MSLSSHFNPNEILRDSKSIFYYILSLIFL